MKKLLTLFLLMFLVACEGDFNINDVVGKWQLQSIDGQALRADVNASLDIQSDGKFSGKAPINRYFGHINVEDGKLTTSPVGSTMMAASPELMDAERNYLTILNDVTSAKVVAGQLVITAKSGQKLVFDKAQ
ncbi:MAG TPA: META domain-containing protein [Arenimonas sp.]|nr:META domain-containing protein [Arenimonas sp.]